MKTMNPRLLSSVLISLAWVRSSANMKMSSANEKKLPWRISFLIYAWLLRISSRQVINKRGARTLPCSTLLSSLMTFSPIFNP